MTNDVEKRWTDPPTFRAAATYALLIVAVAGVAFAVFALVARDSVVAASTVPGILFAGALGAFVKTYRVWKAEGTWPAWQGAGWFLLAATLFCLAIPGATMMAT